MDRLLSEASILLDRYQVESYVAEGGMQQVYRARDLAFDRPVALKVPLNDSAERRFDRSARLSARVIHPNVAKTLDYFEQDERSYLVEELIDGIDLTTYLRRQDPLDPHLAAHILHHLARAVAASHHVNVIHRDLKPGNIMVSDDPAAAVVKVTDFGIAKMAEEEISDAMERGDEESISSSKTAIGALPYMAPEMIEDSKNVGTPADVWAIGALSYRLLAGTPPYGTGLKAVATIIAAKVPPPPAIWSAKPKFEPVLTEDLWAIVTSCLEKDPARRPTADDLAERCSTLAYFTGQRYFGRIHRYPAGQGQFGFISAESGEDIFFHRDSFYSSDRPEPGMPVTFASFPGSPCYRAFPVVPINE